MTPSLKYEPGTFDKGEFFYNFCAVCGRVNSIAVSADVCNRICDICTILAPENSESIQALAYIARVGSGMLSSKLDDAYIVALNIQWTAGYGVRDNMEIECVMMDASFTNFIRMSFFVGDDGSLVNYKNVPSGTYAVAMQNFPHQTRQSNPLV